jgi:hypothetical protein
VIQTLPGRRLQLQRALICRACGNHSNLGESLQKTRNAAPLCSWLPGL